MRISTLIFIGFIICTIISSCATIPYIGPTLTRMGAIELITAGGLSLTIGDITVYFIADKGLEEIIEEMGAFCPPEFQNKSYCILIGTDGNKLTGNFYIQGNIYQGVSLRVATNNDPITCPLPKGTNVKQKLNCNIKTIEKVEDIELMIIEENSHFFISTSSLKNGLKVIKDKEFLKNLKKGRKAFKFFK